MSDEVRLPVDPNYARDALKSTAIDGARLHPTSLEAWARLGDESYDAGEDVTAYAYYRVGYHRGLDQLRGAGWRPDRHVLWAIESNRGFLRSLYGLMRAAAAIGEGVEARRCREFLLQLDPSDPLEVGGIAPKDLSRRLAD
jgi:hypothetical protein